MVECPLCGKRFERFSDPVGRDNLVDHIDMDHVSIGGPYWRCPCGFNVKVQSGSQLDDYDALAKHLQSQPDLKQHLERGMVRLALSRLP